MNISYQPVNHEEAKLAIKLIHDNLSSELLKGQYKDKPEYAHFTFGLCSVASEALYFILGGAKRGLVSYVAKDTDGTTHWWLKDSRGLILDPTVEQYTSVGKSPPYERGILGKPCGFMGMRVDIGNQFGFDRKPSKRASILLDNILTNTPTSQLLKKFSI